MNDKHYNTHNLKKIQKTIVDGPQPLYELFNHESVGRLLSSVQLEYGPYLDRISKKSLRFKMVDKGQDLAMIFGLNPVVFGEKYLQAISGDGQEGRRIRTLHSSALLCLLCFYGLSEKRPLIMSLDGRSVKFTHSTFEVKTPIGTDETGRMHESNMDVVLSGKDMATGKRVIFFLESKFSEYLSWGRYSGISNHVYRKTYAQLFNGNYLDRMGIKLEDSPENEGYSDLSSIKDRTLHYAGGIKQMVSHCLGVNKATGSETYKDSDIYLGTILYRFPNSIDTEGRKFEDYNQIYSVLREGLNDLFGSKVTILKQCLTYQDVFKTYDLEDSIRTFYSL